MDFGIRGKTALVLGGTSGIGLAIAECLAGEGASVVVASRNEAKVREAARIVGGRGFVVDLMSEASIHESVDKLLAETPVDILVNNTGGPATGQPAGIPLSVWDAGYASLLRSVIQVSQLVLPGMRQRAWGRILTITSTSARELIPGLPVSSTFRAALTAWTKELAREVGRSGVLVNNLLPGPTRTARLAELAVKSPTFYESMESTSSLGRCAEPLEIGRVAAFLCSAANGYVTGTDVLADGGYTRAL